MTEQSLIYSCGGRLQALALSHVIEIMRPLPIDRTGEEGPFFTGVCTIRGEPVPVFDLSPLCCPSTATPTRLVNVRAGEKRFAILADAVLGVQTAPGLSQPLLGKLDGDLKAAFGALDADLRRLIQAVRVIADTPAEQPAA